MWDLESLGCGLGRLRGWLANQQDPQINLPLVKDLMEIALENFVIVSPSAPDSAAFRCTAAIDHLQYKDDSPSCFQCISGWPEKWRIPEGT